MLSAYITHPDCARHSMGEGHPECPERLGAINDHLLVKGLLDYMSPYDAPLATLEQLDRAHASLYVRELIDASPTEGLHAVDPDTNMNPHTLTAALRAAAMTRRIDATRSFYSALTPEQQQRFDRHTQTNFQRAGMQGKHRHGGPGPMADRS